MIRLCSKDGWIFHVSKSVIEASKTLKAMLEFQNTDKSIKLDNISGIVLEKVCDYWYYRDHHEQSISKGNIPEFEIDKDMAVELLLVADYLDT